MTQLSSKLVWELANPKWAAALNPLLKLPIISGNMITGVSLVASEPLVINHLLQRMQQGWIITDNTAECSVWRTKPFNTTTLTLESNQDTTIAIWVF